MREHFKWFVANVCLVLIGVFLVLNLLEVELPSVGKSIPELQQGARCVIKNWQGEYVTYPDTERCCLEQRQFAPSCHSEVLSYQGEELTKVCPVNERLEIWLNRDGYRYCTQIWER